MSHAETLRSIANGPHPGLSYSAVVALTAGVDALDAIEEVRKVIDWADREWPELLHAEWRAADGWQRGTSHAAQEIIGRLRDALGDTNDA